MVTEKNRESYVAYEYKEIQAEKETVSFYLDSYECFGWEKDENLPENMMAGRVTLRLKRNRNIINKMELTRLQRNFEACVNEIGMMKKSITDKPGMYSLTIGFIGTAFMAGSVFAVTAAPPHIVLSVLLAIPGFLGWVLPIYIYRAVKRKQTEKMTPFIDQKYEEIYKICEKGHSLL